MDKLEKGKGNRWKRRYFELSDGRLVYGRCVVSRSPSPCKSSIVREYPASIHVLISYGWQ